MKKIVGMVLATGFSIGSLYAMDNMAVRYAAAKHWTKTHSIESSFKFAQLSFAVQGSDLIMRNEGDQVLIYNADAGEEIKRINYQSSVYPLALSGSGDGQKMMVSKEAEISLVDVDTNQKIFEHTGIPDSAKFLDNGKKLIFIDRKIQDNTLEVFGEQVELEFEQTKEITVDTATGYIVKERSMNDALELAKNGCLVDHTPRYTQELLYHEKPQYWTLDSEGKKVHEIKRHGNTITLTNAQHASKAYTYHHTKSTAISIFAPSSNGSKFAVQYYNDDHAYIDIVDVEKRHIEETIACGKEKIQALSFSADSTMLAIARTQGYAVDQPTGLGYQLDILKKQ